MAEAESLQVGIFPLAERQFTATVGKAAELSVRVLRGPHLEPVSGVGVRFEVLSGPLGLGARASRRATARTGDDGIASVPAVFDRRGAGLVDARLVDGADVDAVVFGGHTDGMTSRLVVSAAPATSAERGRIPVRVTALDHRERPVSDAELSLEASIVGGDRPVTVALASAAPGEYVGVFRTRKAGCWRLRAQDRATHVVGDGYAQVVPGDPAHIRLVEEPDPRATPPYSEVGVRVRLVDHYSNAIDPARIRLAHDGAELIETLRTDQEARFLLRRAGSGEAEILLAAGRLRERRSLRFAAAWLADPGHITVGGSFRTPLYVMPRDDEPLSAATVRIVFDRRRTRFVEWTPAAVVPPPIVELAEHELTVEFKPRRPIRPEQADDCLLLGEIGWRCTREGPTLFKVTVRMSPESEPWMLCPTQKREHRRCLCINVISRSGETRAREAGDRALQYRPVEILSTRNIRRCCPSLRVELHHCSISVRDWRTKVLPVLGAGGRVQTHAQVDALYALGLCQRPGCINFLMIDMDHDYADGDAGLIGPRLAGGSFGVINPAYVDTVHNIGAHEVGHVLGLHHVDGGQGDNVMSETQPHGDNLTEKQCKQVWSNLDQYKC